MPLFYVYALCDPRTTSAIYDTFAFPGIPFYIGKGHGKRSSRHLGEALTWKNVHKNPHKLRVIRKLADRGLKPIIYPVVDGLSETAAFDLERMLISLIGRSNLGTGPLTNLTEGGEGPLGYRWTEEQRARLDHRREKNSFYGRSHSNESKAQMSMTRSKLMLVGPKGSFYGRHHSIATKQLLSQKNKGRKIGVFTEEHRNKIASAHRGVPKGPRSSTVIESMKANFKKYGHPHKRRYEIEYDGIKNTISNLKQWCRDNHVSYNMMCATVHGKYESYLGFKIRLI